MPQEFTVNPNGEAVPTGQTQQPEESSGGGYINMSNPVPTESQREAQAGDAEAQRQFHELAEKLGVDVSQLGGEPPAAQPEAVQQAPAPPQPEPTDDMIARFNSREGQRMREEFKQIMGIDPMDAFTTVTQTQQQLQQINQWRQQVMVERQMDDLRQEWGAEFDSTFSEVRERFNQLPDNMKAALDNLDGAKLLAAQIRSERGGANRQGGIPLPRSSAPSRTNNIRSTGAPVGYVKTSDYLNDRVSEQDYLAALRSNRVIRDI